MRIVGFQPRPFHRLRYTNAAKRGGVESALLEFRRAIVDQLPEGLGGLLATSDLQGVLSDWRSGVETTLLGERLPAVYRELAEDGRLPRAACVGAVLAGDFYSAPAGDKRGASGDVRSVWQAFADAFAWVAGVAGNHDQFGSVAAAESFQGRPSVRYLDCDMATESGLRLAGVGYVIGDPKKPGRRDEEDYLARLELVLEQSPEILVLHEGPPGGRSQPGNRLIGELLGRFPPLLVICGHSHWDDPLYELDNGTQVLNVDARAVLLTSA